MAETIIHMNYKQVLNDKLKELEALDFQSLVPYADREEVLTYNENIEAKEYQIEVDIFYDSPKKDRIIVIGSIDDGGWRAIFFPYSKGFQKVKN